MEEDDEIQSQASPASGSPRSNGRITVTVAAPAPTTQPAQNQNALALALPRSNGREDCWSEGATAVLIEAWGERYLELSRGNLKQKHWKEVAEKVSSREHYTKTPKTDVQCKNRIDTVKKKYKSEKAKIASGGGPSKWPFFDRLDHLIGPSAKIAASVSVGPGTRTQTQTQAQTQTQTQKVPLGIPVGFRSAQHHHQQQPLKRPKMQFRRRPPVDSDSERDSSPVSTDSFPPETTTYERKKPPRLQREVNSNAGTGKGREVGGGGDKGGWGNAVRELRQAILKFGEAYEQAESLKLQQLVEMEKQRMKFAKELELKRMQFFMDTQLEISQIKHGRRSGNGRNHHSSNNENNSDSSN